MTVGTPHEQEIKSTLGIIVDVLQRKYPTIVVLDGVMNRPEGTFFGIKLGDTELQRMLGSAYPSSANGNFAHIGLKSGDQRNGYTSHQHYYFGEDSPPEPKHQYWRTRANVFANLMIWNRFF